MKLQEKIWDIEFFIKKVFGIKRFIKSVKWFLQRGKSGYADCDLWDFHVYLSKVTANGLKDFRENLTSFPAELTLKQWEKILEKIEKGFRLHLEQGNDFDRKTSKQIDRALVKSFDLMKQYYRTLWD